MSPGAQIYMSTPLYATLVDDIFEDFTRSALLEDFRDQLRLVDRLENANGLIRSRTIKFLQCRRTSGHSDASRRSMSNHFVRGDHNDFNRKKKTVNIRVTLELRLSELIGTRHYPDS